MSGHRLRLTLVSAAVAALMVAAPALAGGRAPAAMRAEAFGPQAPRAFTVERPLSSVAPGDFTKSVGSEGRAELAGHWGYRPYGYGWYGYWDPFWYPGWWYPGMWWYGGPIPGHVAMLEPAVPKDQALVALQVVPSRAVVFVDGTERGKTAKFSTVTHPLWLKPGEHVIELRKDGYQALRLDLHLEGGHAYSLSYDLSKGEGVDPRSSEASS